MRGDSLAPPIPHLMKKLEKQTRWGSWLYGFLLIGVVLGLYAPALHFGLIWDDPKWYQQGAGQSLWQIFTALPTYQFYRPLAILLNRQLVSPANVVQASLAHALQFEAHALATLAVIPVLRTLEFDRWHARLAALLFAVYPLSYQAVAWEAPQQPLTLLGLLLSLLLADQFSRRRQWFFLGASLAVYLAALLFQESALLFVFVFFWLAFIHWRKDSRWRRHAWPLGHLGLASLYFLIWLNVPRQGQVTGLGFQPGVLAYVLQGIVFPFAALVPSPLAEWDWSKLIVLFAVLVCLLIGIVWKGRVTLLSCAWILAGALPLWAGLSWEYVQIGSRLLYPASLGIAALWSGWAAWAFSPMSRWRRAVGSVALGLVLTVSLNQIWQFQKLYQLGTQHLAQARAALAADPESHLLFVNFPDRIEIRPPLYPVGFWGLVLAPVIQNLADYARAEIGRSGEDQSLSNFRVGAEARQAWPYQVNLRGVDGDPAQFLRAAQWADSVYLTDYLPEGALRLRDVGQVREPAFPYLKPMARFEESVELVEAQISTGPDALNLRLIWRCQQPLQPEDTVFIHFWRDGEFIRGEDGDSLGGLVPLSVWQPGTEIVDQRRIELDGFEPGTYEVWGGLYNRASGVRYQTFLAQDNALSEAGVLIGKFTVP